MSLRSRLQRLERLAREDIIEIPQVDGTVACFPESAITDAFENIAQRLAGGREAVPEHPLVTAARNSADPTWRNSIFATEVSWDTPIPDLSED